MKKILALLLALVMVLSLMTACAKKPAESSEGEKTPETPKTDDAQQPTTSGTPAAEKKDSWLCDEKTTLTLFTYDRVNNTYEIPSNDLPFWQWMEDYTNVHIEWEIAPNAGYEEVIATKLSSGADLADIVMVKDPIVANNAGKNGLFVNLGEYWDEIFTNIDAYYKSIGFDYFHLFANEDGSMYAIDGTVEPVEGHILIMYNTEWMQKLGASLPKTIDEFTALMHQMKDAGDLNGNGKDDEIILTSSSTTHIFDILGNAFGIEQYEGWNAAVADENGKVVTEYVTDAWKNTARYCAELYADGILDQEINSNSMDILSEKIAADRVGCFIFYSAFAFNYGSLTSAGLKDPYGEHYTLGYPLSSEYVKDPYFTLRAIVDNTSTGVNVNCEHKELAMKWLDVLLADPKATEVRIRGFEGEDWEYNADGVAVPIPQADGTMPDIAKKGCGQIALPHYQNADSFMFFATATPWYSEQYKYIRGAKWLVPSVPQVGVYTEQEQEWLDEVGTDVNDYVKEMRNKFVDGQADVDKDWDTYLKTLDQLGLETYTKVYQSVYDRTK